MLRVGVLGAGVIGLSTAVELQLLSSDVEVTIIADKFNQDTTSDGAAGIFRPGLSFSASTDQITNFIIQESYTHYSELFTKYNPYETGVCERSGFIFSSNNKNICENTLIDKIVPVYRSATEEELRQDGHNWKYGTYFVTTVTECRRYLPWIMKRFLQNKGKVNKERITSFNDLTDARFDVVVNCLGFGAKDVCKDRKLVPIRGQVLKVSAPWLKQFLYADYDTYIIPGLDQVTLGGCRQYDSYDLNINKYDSASIYERCCQLLPGLKDAPVLREWVGLRPHRDPVRLEMEIVDIGGHKMKVVHNYGHGGYGVTTAPGSAKYAVKLVKDILSTNSCKL